MFGRACKINWRASATKKMTYRTLSGQSVARLPDTSAGPAKLIITNHLADASPHLWIEGEVSIDGVTYQQYDTHIYINDALFDEIQHLSRGCLADAKLGQST